MHRHTYVYKMYIYVYKYNTMYIYAWVCCICNLQPMKKYTMNSMNFLQHDLSPNWLHFYLPPAALHSCPVEGLHRRYAELQFRCVPCCGGKCPRVTDTWLGWWGSFSGSLKRNSFSPKSSAMQGARLLGSMSKDGSLWWILKRALVFLSVKRAWGGWNKVLSISKIHI